jgi:hypothetical protein
MVVDGTPVLVYCALDKKLGKSRRTVAWAVAKDPSDPLLLEWLKPKFQPWVNTSLHDPAVFCDPLTYKTNGVDGQQMVGAIVRDRGSHQITSWQISSLHSAPTRAGIVYDLGFECLCPDLAFYGNGLWSAKCLAKCGIPNKYEIGCDVYAIGSMVNNSFAPSKRLAKSVNDFPLFDHGSVAASAQTMQDPKLNRTLLWQWLPEGDCLGNQRNCSGPKRRWQGTYVMPRRVWPSEACATKGPADAGCVLLVRVAPEIDQLVTWRKEIAVEATGVASVSVAADENPNAIKFHARFPANFTSSKTVSLELAAWAGGPAVWVSLLDVGVVSVGPSWRIDSRHKPTPQIKYNATCTIPPGGMQANGVVEAFLDASVLEVFSDTGPIIFFCLGALFYLLSGLFLCEGCMGERGIIC